MRDMVFIKISPFAIVPIAKVCYTQMSDDLFRADFHQNAVSVRWQHFSFGAERDCALRSSSISEKQHQKIL